MELREISPDQWSQIDRSVTSLAVCAGLGLCGSLAFLALRVVAPSAAAAETAGIPRWVRWSFVLVPALALLGAGIALAVGIALAIEVLASIYPRFLI